MLMELEEYCPEKAPFPLGSPFWQRNAVRAESGKRVRSEKRAKCRELRTTSVPEFAASWPTLSSCLRSATWVMEGAVLGEPGVGRLGKFRY